MIMAVVSVSCEDLFEEDEDESDPTPSGTTLVGQDGNPRFNLQFTNPNNVDMDLYVKTPNGTIIYYGNPTGQMGTLDVDCKCSGCSMGPNENIFWQNGTAPSGTYEYWVNYYGGCGGSGATSSFTLRVIRNGTVLQTRTGSMSSVGSTGHWTFQQ